MLPTELFSLVLSYLTPYTCARLMRVNKHLFLFVTDRRRLRRIFDTYLPPQENLSYEGMRRGLIYLMKQPEPISIESMKRARAITRRNYEVDIFGRLWFSGPFWYLDSHRKLRDHNIVALEEFFTMLNSCVALNSSGVLRLHIHQAPEVYTIDKVEYFVLRDSYILVRKYNKVWYTYSIQERTLSPVTSFSELLELVKFIGSTRTTSLTGTGMNISGPTGCTGCSGPNMSSITSPVNYISSAPLVLIGETGCVGATGLTGPVAPIHS